MKITIRGETITETTETGMIESETTGLVMIGLVMIGSVIVTGETGVQFVTLDHLVIDTGQIIGKIGVDSIAILVAVTVIDKRIDLVIDIEKRIELMIDIEKRIELVTVIEKRIEIVTVIDRISLMIEQERAMEIRAEGTVERRVIRKCQKKSQMMTVTFQR